MNYTVIAFDRIADQYNLYIAGSLVGHASTYIEALTTIEVLAYGEDDE